MTRLKRFQPHLISSSKASQTFRKKRPEWTASFYEHFCLRVASHSKYDHLKTMLDVPVFRKRINIAASTFLFEADFRGAEEGRPVHVIVVGLGTGVWALQRQNQERLMVEEYKKVMEVPFLS